jgi:hypothetical protein
VVGEPVDEKGPVDAKMKFRSIHQPAPEFIEQSTESVEILVTGIKVVDLLAPYSKGGKIGLFGGAGVGKTVLIHGTDQQHRQGALGLRRCSPAWASGRARATTSTTNDRADVIKLDNRTECSTRWPSSTAR